MPLAIFIAPERAQTPCRPGAPGLSCAVRIPGNAGAHIWRFRERIRRRSRLARFVDAHATSVMSENGQDDVVRALGDPRLYPDRPATVEHVQTHISHVFLAGPWVYKLKKAVRFPFLDFGSLERRRHFCLEEVRLNRRLCPAVYRDVVAVTRGAGGRLALGGDGPAADYLVRMRRLPAEGMLVRRLEARAVRPETMDALARTLAAFHADAPTGPEVAAHADPEVLRRRWEEETASTAAFVGRLLPAEDHEVLADFGPAFIRTHETLLRARQQGGRVREGHGDLHAANVCVLDAPVPGPGDLPPLPAGPYVFDCIEFSWDFRCNDVASEVAFLAMDLESRDRPDLAGRFVDAYVEAAPDATLPALLPFYACYRAAVRGKVAALESDQAEVAPADRAAAAARARRYFHVAVRHAWSADGPAMIACAGLSGTGKSTLAAEIAAVTGFVPVASDVVRRRGAGGRPAVAPYGAGGYTAAARATTYEALAAEVDRTLEAGRGAIADATYLRAADRQRLAAVARRHRRALVFVECHADAAVVRERLAGREHGPPLSDARWDTYLAQREGQEPLGEGEPHVIVDTTAGLAAARASALRALWQWRRGRSA
jgi:aminoglycoside phosphotransferase family enzyme/predicted kinase